MNIYQKIITTTCALVISFSSPNIANAADFEVGSNVAQDYIINSYQELSEAAQWQSIKLETLCAHPSQNALNLVQEQFSTLVQAWSHIEMVRFGPALNNNNWDRILFWPDRKGIGLRQVQGILHNEDPAAIDMESLRAKSVAVQGLLALEFTLFGTGFEDFYTIKNNFRCKYALAISQAITTTAQEIEADWGHVETNEQTGTGYSIQMASPGPQHADYRNSDEVLRKLIGIWAYGIEMVRDTRLKQLLPTTERNGHFKRGLFWRSNLTFVSMAANMSGMQDLLSSSGIIDLLEPEKQWIINTLDFELENFRRTASELSHTPIDELVADIQMQNKMAYLNILTHSAQAILIDELATGLNITAGFSALDGD